MYLIISQQHSGNVLVHQNNIKLANFGLSKKIHEASKKRTSLFDVVPYIDPKKIKSNNLVQYSLNVKSDVYSIGVLLWEISSGRPPFYVKNVPYDTNLVMRILQGHRETIISGTPTDYSNLYTGKYGFLFFTVLLVICVLKSYITCRMLGW